MITQEELNKIAMPTSSLKVNDPKTGIGGYRVGLEVFHQLHCINLLRQVTYKDHYSNIGSGMLAAGEEELQKHTGKQNKLPHVFLWANRFARSLSRGFKNEHPVYG